MTIRKMKYERKLDALRNQIEDIAASFGWNPRDNWIQELKRQLSMMLAYFEEQPASPSTFHQMTYTVYRRLDPRLYTSHDGQTITARYSNDTDPNPLAVFALVRTFPLIGDTTRYPWAGNMVSRVVIGSHETQVFGSYGELLATFKAYGRKMHLGDAFRAYNAQQLIKELLGIEIDISEIALPDMQHLYPEIVLERDINGAIHQKEGQTVRA